MLSANIRQYLPSQKITAIKAYRSEHPVDLKTAKAAVDAFCSREPYISPKSVEAKMARLMALMGVAAPDSPAADITERVAQLVRNNKKIEAIVEYRDTKNTTFGEAKAAVEKIEDHVFSGERTLDFRAHSMPHHLFSSC